MPDDPLIPLSDEELRRLLEAVDTAIAEGRDLRQRIVDAMRERRHHPSWPMDNPREKRSKLR